MSEQPRRAARPLEGVVELRELRVARTAVAAEEQHLGDRMAAFVDGELDHDARERVQSHLAGCAACLARAEEERRIKRRLAAALPPDPSMLFMSRLMAIAGSGGDSGDSLDDDERNTPGGRPPRRGFGAGAFGGSAFGGSVFGGGETATFGHGSGFGRGALGAERPVPGVDPRAERGASAVEPTPIAARLRAGRAPGAPVDGAAPSRPGAPGLPAREPSRPSAARGRRFAFAAAGAFSVAAVALGSAITGVTTADQPVEEPYGNVTPVADTSGAVAGFAGVRAGYAGSGQLALGVPANAPGSFSQLSSGRPYAPSGAASATAVPTPSAVGAAGNGHSLLR
ncbi:zf-HC2 domain-containing protein [Streptacidiphilus sp. EB129]|uniref:zf-HC2 domain-containing protein n=1 Tax=Streptacidiphilus sp. EB129 TaxID=3156262 RepID=UPI00351653B9